MTIDNYKGNYLMKRFILIFTLTFASYQALAFDSFSNESSKITKLLKCEKPKTSPAVDSGWGALYSCIGGNAETVKFFINEEAGTGKVKNIKFMWNDWTKDKGYGKHTDSKTAKKWIKILAATYAPKKQKEIISTFFSKADKEINDGNYSLKYSYHVGPAIDERIIIITLKKQDLDKIATINSEKSDFEYCKSAISKAVKYSESNFSGDGDPSKEDGYKSFMIKGKGEDLFFCEVYKDKKYKIKAALNGEYPFKYIANGSFE